MNNGYSCGAVLSEPAMEPLGYGPKRPVLEVNRPTSGVTNRLTVLLADDYAIVRAGLRSLLSSVEWITVVAETSVGDVRREVLLNRPDVLVLGDCAQPEIDTIIGELARSAPSVAVLVFSAAEDDEAELAAILAGASGYVRKAAEQDDLLRAIGAVAAGWILVSPQIGGRITTMLAGSASTIQRRFPELTARELDVLTLVAQGMSNSAIAAALHLAPKTIRNHLSRIFGKLGVDGRANAIILAREAGLGTPDDRPRRNPEADSPDRNRDTQIDRISRRHPSRTDGWRSGG